MTVGLTFRTKSIKMTDKKYKETIRDIFSRVLTGQLNYYHYYFSRSSESVYVIGKFKEKSGYLLFSIKSHREFRLSSVKVFNTNDCYNFKQLEKDINSYIDGAKTGKYSLFNFKYGNFLGLKSLVNLNNKGYSVLTSENNYLGSLTGDIYYQSANGDSSLVKVTDETFLFRLYKLVHSGLVRGYSLETGFVRFYVTDYGFNLLRSKEHNYMETYVSDIKNKSIEGMLDRYVH